MTTDKAAAFKREIENTLSFILAMDDQASTTFQDIKVAPTAPDVNARYFSGLEPLHPRLLAAIPFEDNNVVPSNAFRSYPTEAARVVDNFDVCAVVQASESDGTPIRGMRFALTRARAVTPKMLRGRALGAAASNVEITSALVTSDLKFVTSRHYLARTGSGYRLLGHPDRRFSGLSNDARADIETWPLMYLGLAIGRHYSWAVRFSFPTTPSIHLTTDPLGAAALLRLRDAPPKRRREAIVHWVADHWRRRRHDPSAVSHVRAHLRGKTSFTWDGLHCEVIPSAADREAAARGEGPVEPPWAGTDALAHTLARKV